MTTLRVRHMAGRTEKTHEHWLARYRAFHGWRPLGELGAAEVAAFLEHLAVRRQVASATQRIALNALVFVKREVLGQDLALGDLHPCGGQAPRAGRADDGRGSSPRWGN